MGIAERRPAVIAKWWAYEADGAIDVAVEVNRTEADEVAIKVHLLNATEPDVAVDSVRGELYLSVEGARDLEVLIAHARTDEVSS